MASGHPGDAVRQINRLFLDGTVGALTDGQLLERFATRRPEAAEAAFEALVGRHGPMVLRVCRGVLRDPHDVDDAFQATFLVLVRKANSIGERELLGPWLYGVAHRVALKARGVAARRNKREGGIVDDPPAELAEGPWLDLRPMLHEELNRLPEKYRKPVVLCHLQGLTHAEAAQELAWPVGTVSVRLSRARKLLKERLTRRGLTVTATLWAAGLSLEGASASVPRALIHSTTIAARSFAAGKVFAAGTVSVGSVALAKRILTMMWIARLKWAVAPLVLGVSTVGAVTLAQRTPETPLQAGEQVVVKGGGAPANPSGAPRSVESPPPGYFDLPLRAKKDGVAPSPIIKPGQVIVVDVLEALPGRPITGERLVRADGTISLGFYGDLPVAGLNRTEAKIKVLEHLCKYLNDEVLGLMVFDMKEQRLKFIHSPAESNRVFIQDDLEVPRKYATDGAGAGVGGVKEGQVITVEALKALPGRPITGERVVGPDGTINLGFYGDVHVLGLNREQIKVKVIEHLRKYLNDEALGLIDVHNQGNRKVVPPAESANIFIDDAILPGEPRTAEAVLQLRGQVKSLNIKLDRVLKELEEIRREHSPVKP